MLIKKSADVSEEENSFLREIWDQGYCEILVNYMNWTWTLICKTYFKEINITTIFNGFTVIRIGHQHCISNKDGSLDRFVELIKIEQQQQIGI